MTTDATPVLIDSNILIFASISTAEFHTATLESLDRVETEDSPAWISTQIIREYLVHMTRPDVLGTRTIEEVVQQVGRLQDHYRLAYDNESSARALLGLVNQFGVQGKKIHDANIVATAMAYGIPRLLTHNRADFERYSSLIQIETP